MARPKEKLLLMLREQMGLLHTSLNAFYGGSFTEALRIATTIRVLVHETRSSKPLLTQLRPDGLTLQIPEYASEARLGEDEFIRFAVGIRLGPGTSISPAVDVHSCHYSLTSIGSWWAQSVFTFPSRIGTQVTYSRKQVVLILANREGGAHVDQNEDPNYVRLLTDQPLNFMYGGVQLETPDLAKFLVAQSGVELMECLKSNFFLDYELPPRWEFGIAPPVAMYVDQISVKAYRVTTPFPSADIRVTKRI